MANHQVLDNITHQDLKIITDQHPDYGDIHSYASLVPSELSAAQTDYPLFFRKNASTQSLELIALLGLGESENLFLNASGWHAYYLPLSIQRKPFLIGFIDNNGVKEPQIHIDMDSPRISSEIGESVFLPQGGQSEYLQGVSSILLTLHSGHQEAANFIKALTQAKLIESVSLSIQLNNGEKVELSELLTINEDNLNALDADTLVSLHQNGYLKYIYMMISSINNMTKLIEKKNNLLQEIENNVETVTNPFA